MSVYNWSQTAGTNANADATINWAEGQAPSSINDSARAMMAAISKWRDDISGSITTGGTSTAYTITSNSAFDTLAHMAGQLIAFVPHTTSGATVTLNVDSLGAKPLRLAPNVEIRDGTLIQGTPYVAVYNNSDAAFYLFGSSNSAYSIPLGSSIEYWGTTAPNSAFALPYGQAISRTTYATLFSLIGTTYGTGDGSTTFNIPDLRGRVTACPDNMGGSDANRLNNSAITSVRTSLGGAGGEGTHTLTTAEMPTHNHGVTDPGHTHGSPSGNFMVFTSGTSSGAVTGSAGAAIYTQTATSSASTGISIQNNGSGTAHNVVQPTILCNRIMRII